MPPSSSPSSFYSELITVFFLYTSFLSFLILFELYAIGIFELLKPFAFAFFWKLVGDAS